MSPSTGVDDVLCPERSCDLPAVRFSLACLVSRRKVKVRGSREVQLRTTRKLRRSDGLVQLRRDGPVPRECAAGWHTARTWLHAEPEPCGFSGASGSPLVLNLRRNPVLPHHLPHLRPRSMDILDPETCAYAVLCYVRVRWFDRG